MRNRQGHDQGRRQATRSPVRAGQGDRRRHGASRGSVRHPCAEGSRVLASEAQASSHADGEHGAARTNAVARHWVRGRASRKPLDPSEKGTANRRPAHEPASIARCVPTWKGGASPIGPLTMHGPRSPKTVVERRVVAPPRSRATSLSRDGLAKRLHAGLRPCTNPVPGRARAEAFGA